MSNTAVADKKEKFTIPLAKMSLNAWPGRTDTKGIVSSLMISLVMIGIMQFGERLDTILTGGLFPVSGRIISITMIGFGTMLYGVVGGLIVSEINPLIATATGTSPIAPFFFITNACQVLSAWITGKVFDNVLSWKACILNAVLATVFLVALYIPMHIIYFHMPVEKMMSLYFMQSVFSLTVPAVLLRMLLKVVKDAGFVED
ncbi:MAG TPA: hypothetical protein VHS28_01595 [Chloroflexota bacterium]|nr:hypothetical protein [Chloroflexota bacterium]